MKVVINDVLKILFKGTLKSRYIANLHSVERQKTKSEMFLNFVVLAI